GDRPTRLPRTYAALAPATTTCATPAVGAPPRSRWWPGLDSSPAAEPTAVRSGVRRASRRDRGAPPHSPPVRPRTALRSIEGAGCPTRTRPRRGDRRGRGCPARRRPPGRATDCAAQQTMVQNEVDARARRERRQPFEQLDRFEQEVRGAVAPFRLQGEEHAAHPLLPPTSPLQHPRPLRRTPRSSRVGRNRATGSGPT